jgi:hypothetical protein
MGEGRGAREGERASEIPRGLLLVLLGLMLPIGHGAVNLVNGCYARRGANGAFLIGCPYRALLRNGSRISFRKSGPANLVVGKRSDRERREVFSS